YGRARLTEETYGHGHTRAAVLPIVAALERYSRHPLAAPIVEAAAAGGWPLPEVEWVREEPGRGLRGRAAGVDVLITSRRHARLVVDVPGDDDTGLECVVLLDGRLAAVLRFHDVARRESGGFIRHLGPQHGVGRVMIVSGDREAEVRRL